MPWIEPITDRNLADVQYANEHRDSPLPLKGARNYTDMIRITGNIAYVHDVLAGFGYNVPPQQSKLTWTIGEIPNAAEIDKIKQDIGALRGIAYVLSTTPAVPELPYTHYEKINAVEKILFDIKMLIERREAGFIFSREMLSGEVWHFGFSV